ncbi:hypothetical protein RHOFW104T7_15725 [Rhodanobacter thiooxydans]|uniref:Uncharacterized protein n=1 Tax=Rhodanobacter thiooxydans TaxID=416169 RepID=A0A154QFN8_9GAMM|nr:hypothetical protein [Rhodanobacter thiooxydans]EIL98246.1 hypothetical protein UUA_12298 [Rhodanobacter thiooxydans LCS2]KZC22995.1 hypothetical protein RHOFW104T7_15725 [Rhodanobacter thiooxydans]
MPHGSTLPHTGDPSRAHRWRAAWRRGAILGGVTALHLFTLALLLRPAPPYRPTTTLLRGGAVMQLHLLARPGKRPAASPRSPSPRHPRSAQAANPARTLPADVVPRPHAAMLVVAPAIAPNGSDDYHAALAGAAAVRWAPRVRLPGSDAPSRTGIPLRAAPSLRQLVQAMTTASRCKYERMKMERSANQFVTRQLAERALDADGCGPQGEHDAIDPTIDAISRRATRGD